MSNYRIIKKWISTNYGWGMGNIEKLFVIQEKIKRKILFCSWNGWTTIATIDPRNHNNSDMYFHTFEEAENYLTYIRMQKLRAFS